MAHLTLTEIIALLETRKAEGVIWNPEMEDMKFSLGRIIDRFHAYDRAKLVENVDTLLGIKRAGGIYNSYDLYVAAKNIQRIAEKKSLTEAPAVVAFFAAWAPYIVAANLMNDLKPMVKKGRQPNPEAEARKERDLENTGTCGCCGRNIKLGFTDGNIWDHGFAIANRGYGFAAGYKTGASCFGTGYQPIELSPACWIDMLSSWKRRVLDLPAVIERLEAQIASLAKPVSKMDWQMTKEEKDYAKTYGMTLMSLRECKSELSHLKLAIPEMTEKIANWAPKPLPGTSRK
jgi:hypothetical protein